MTTELIEFCGIVLMFGTLLVGMKSLRKVKFNWEL